MCAACRSLVPGAARRPATPDGLPVIDRALGFDNLFSRHCGHFRNGVLLAPATGKLLSEWISTDTAPEELAPFNAGRFGK